MLFDRDGSGRKEGKKGEGEKKGRDGQRGRKGGWRTVVLLGIDRLVLNAQDCGCSYSVSGAWVHWILRKIDRTSLLRCRCPDFDEIWQADAEYYADYCDMLENETGSRIPIWRTLVVPNLT